MDCALSHVKKTPLYFKVHCLFRERGVSGSVYPLRPRTRKKAVQSFHKAEVPRSGVNARAQACSGCDFAVVLPQSIDATTKTHMAVNFDRKYKITNPNRSCSLAYWPATIHPASGTQTQVGPNCGRCDTTAPGQEKRDV